MRLLPKAQRIVMARFRRRNEAEAHRKALQRLMPTAILVLVFDGGRQDIEKLTDSDEPVSSSQTSLESTIEDVEIR